MCPKSRAASYTVAVHHLGQNQGSAVRAWGLILSAPFRPWIHLSSSAVRAIAL